MRGAAIGGGRGRPVVAAAALRSPALSPARV
jgi:hypothetical protein